MKFLNYLRIQVMAYTYTHTDYFLDFSDKLLNVKLILHTSKIFSLILHLYITPSPN